MSALPALSVEDAQTRILGGMMPSLCEVVGLEAAMGRVLARDVTAVRDSPPFTNSAMDGYAVRATCVRAGAWMPVTATIGAGQVPGPLTPGSAARIFTGAPMPPGADSVVMQEQTERRQDSVLVRAPVTCGQYVRPRGGDVGVGEGLLAAGTPLGAAEIGALASQGMGTVEVRCRPKVAIVSTGDELTPVGGVCPPGKIYDANSHLLAALVASAGGVALVRQALPDRADALSAGLFEACRVADMVLVSGGVSVGDFDFVRTCLQQIGTMAFWRVALKPGKPLAFGHVGQTPLFGLPGNPVSCFVCFELFVRPALRLCLGLPRVLPPKGHACLAAPWASNATRREFVRAKLTCDQAGTLWAAPLSHQGSHHMRSLTGADCLLDIPAACGTLAAGRTVQTLTLDTRLL